MQDKKVHKSFIIKNFKKTSVQNTNNVPRKSGEKFIKIHKN